MAGIFPASVDGGLAPNPGNLSNPARAYPPANLPIDTAALYYGNGCDVRLRPEVLNSLISEVEAVIDEGGLNYHASSQQNMETAIRYLIQRGIPHAGYLVGGPFDYTLILDPPPAQYSDYMLLVVVPEQTNNGISRVNLNGLGFVDIVRRDGSPLEAGDLIQNRPSVMVYYAGQMHLLWAFGGAASAGAGEVDGWIRTDGNDTTGDGTANTPDKAFRTINGALARLVGMYTPGLNFRLNLRLGIPGTYEAGLIVDIPCRVTLTGDPANRANYKISGKTGLQNNGWCIYVARVLSVAITGVTFLIDQPGVVQYGVSNHDCTVFVIDCNVKCNIANSSAAGLVTLRGAMFLQGDIYLQGAGAMMSGLICWAGIIDDAGLLPGHRLNVTNMAFNTAFIWLHNLAVADMNNPIVTSGCSGPSYTISTNSVLNRNGATLPGNGSGSLTTGGILT